LDPSLRRGGKKIKGRRASGGGDGDGGKKDLSEVPFACFEIGGGEEPERRAAVGRGCAIDRARGFGHPPRA